MKTFCTVNVQKSLKKSYMNLVFSEQSYLEWKRNLLKKSKEKKQG